MARFGSGRIASLAVIAGMTVTVSACGGAKPAPIVAAPPPPPVVVATPRMPAPPSNAMLAMTVPALRADGLRATPMRDIDDNEKLWYFRSALNVAALNCQSPQHYRISDDYNAFITTHKRELDRANKAVEADYRKRYGTGFARVRDTQNTQVYNFFAFPPVKYDFCDAAMVLGQEAAALPSKDLIAFSARALPQLEGVFDRFYASYESYQSDLQQWIALYGSPEMRAAQAGPSAMVQTAGQPATVQPSTGQQTVIQPSTGLPMPGPTAGPTAGQSASPSAPVTGNAPPVLQTTGPFLSGS